MRPTLDTVSDAFKRVIMDGASGKRAQQEAAQAAHLGYNVPQAQPAAYQATQAAYAPVQQQYPQVNPLHMAHAVDMVCCQAMIALFL